MRHISWRTLHAHARLPTRQSVQAHPKPNQHHRPKNFKSISIGGNFWCKIGFHKERYFSQVINDGHLWHTFKCDVCSRINPFAHNDAACGCSKIRSKQEAIDKLRIDVKISVRGGVTESDVVDVVNEVFDEIKVAEVMDS